MLDVLRELSSESRAWLDALNSPTQVVTGQTGYRLREERDAVHLAFQFAGVMPPAEELAGVAEVETDVGLGSAIDAYFLLDTEDDLLTVDLRRFDDSGELPLHRASVARYEHDGIAITVVIAPQPSVLADRA